jgi:hypothetical protein
LGGVDPIEVRRGEAQDAVVGEGLPAVGEEPPRVGQREVLEEVLGEDQRAAGKG